MRDLKTNLASYLRRIESGEQITVTRRGKPLATITPIGETYEQRIERKFRELEARGVLTRGNGGKPQGLHPRIRLRGKGPTLSEMIIEDRR